MRNYILSSVNLVNLSKLIKFNQPIDDKKLAQIIEYSIFSAFKKNEKKKIIEKFKKYLKEDENIEEILITPIKNIKRSHEYYLKICEINILSYYYINNEKNNDLLKSMNEKIFKVIDKSELNENIINKEIKKDEIIRDIPRKYLLENLESFTLLEVKDYINDINEVITIYQLFLEENEEYYQCLYFLLYLKLILSDLCSIDEEKLYIIKIKHMKCNKEFFLQYINNIDHNKADKYTNILIRFKNMIYYFDKIIPKRINILDLENSIFSFYYKYYYEQFDKKNKNFMQYFPFLLLSNQNLREKAKKLEFKNKEIPKNIIKLFNTLKLYSNNGEINVDTSTNEIIINDKKINLDEDIDISQLETELGITKKDISSKIDFNKDIISYYYPNKFYQKDNLFQLLFYFLFFIPEYINNNELQKIIPNELYEFNLVIKLLLNTKKFFYDNGEKIIWDKKYNFNDIIDIGYVLLEVISNVKKINEIKLNKGIDFFETRNNNIQVNEENINTVIEKIEIIKDYFNAPNLWISINDKYNILKEKKNEFMFQNVRNKLDRKLKTLTSDYKKLLKDDNYKFLNENIRQIQNEIKDNINKEDLEEKINDIEKKLIAIKK